MKIYHGLPTHKLASTAITVGAFDGLHWGHQELLSYLKTVSRERKITSTVVTFSPHPKQVLKPQEKFRLLYSNDEKEKLFQKLAIDNLVILPFDKKMAGVSQQKFIQTYLHEALQMKCLVTGYDNHFGDKSQPNSSLKEILSNISVEHLRYIPIQVEGMTVSSSLIKSLLTKGDISEANRLLSRPFSLSGEVQRGHGLGKTLGFATANMTYPTEKMLPKDGVYAVQVSGEFGLTKGMCNIGYRPTVSSCGEKSVEVHLFDLQENLYEKSLTIYFFHYIRSEQKFSSPDELKTQLNKDRASVSLFFQQHPSNISLDKGGSIL